jgi:antitoxin (DNA-binding transcriptional repressor) of toxin-antitoxin stability system
MPLRLRPHFLLITAVNEAVARIVPTDAFQASLALTVTKKPPKANASGGY